MEQTAQPMTREEALALKNKRTGLTIFQLSWMMTFVCLVLVNWQIRSRALSWPPAGVDPLNPLLPTLATGGLLASAFLARSGLKAIAAGALEPFLSAWRAAMILGAAFIAIMVFEFFSLPATSIDTQYGMIFRVMTGFHAVHALVIGLMMLNVYRGAAAGAYTPRNLWSVEGTAKLWYFVAAAWMLFYVVLYWL